MSAAKSASKDKKYVMVQVDSAGDSGPPTPVGIVSDVKVGAAPPSTSAIVSMTKGQFSAMMSGRGRNRRDSVKVKIPIRIQSTGSTNTFYAPVYPLVPNSTGVTEATNWAALYDMARCTEIELHCRVYGNGTGSTDVTWGVVYDPANNGAYASVVGTLISTNHIGPIAINDPNGGIQTVNASGFKQMTVKVPSVASTAGASTANETVGSDWFACSDTNVVCGYLKWAVDAAGGIAYVTEAFVVYHMEYKMRT